MESENPSLHIHNGSYKGDISALCILEAPWSSPFPLLLAGTGPQLLVFDMSSYELLLSSCVFEGVRMHGIGVCSSTLGPWECLEKTGVCTVIAVHGERTVKLSKLIIQEKLVEGQQSIDHAKLIPYQKLPRFSHWVLDVQFLKDNHMTIGTASMNLIAIGVSNNAVYLWSASSCAFIYHVQCTERCLLYSLRFWGENPANLLVAAGTIFNEILVWGLDVQLPDALLRNGNPILKENFLEEIDKTVVPKRRLKGHEGSIFRISWSQNGSQLASVSDDRSMRVWSIGKEPRLLSETSMVEETEGSLLAFYGHTGRIWDCHIDQKFLISVSEDCTYRVWSQDGQLLTKVSAHIGRGIWRCVYDSGNAILVTAGADSAIKVHSLSKWLLGADISKDKKVMMRQGPKLEVFSVNLEQEDSFRKNGRLDSKSEYVRCLSLIDPTCLVVATNQGFLKYLCFSKEGQQTWTEVYGNPDLEPILCLDVLRHNGNLFSDDHHGSSEDWVVIGDSKGFVTVICGNWNNGIFQKTYLCKWPAEGERKLLGVYWSQSLGPSYVFTADTCGAVCMWNLRHHNNQLDGSQNAYSSNELSYPANSSENTLPSVVRFQSCFNVRIVCVDAYPEAEILVCGDQRGNIAAFSMPLFSPLVGLSVSSQQPFASFKGAHGISTVASIHIAGKRNQHQIKICSTGRDGCMCTFAVDKSVGTLICLRVEKVPAVTVLENYAMTSGLVKSAPRRTVVSGFTAVDFLICDLYSDCEIVRIPCGGWRRPHSYLIGDFPEVQYCVVFLKDGLIHIHRKWLSDVAASSPASTLPIASNSSFLSSLLLQSQFHGREVHSVNIISSRNGSRSESGIHPVSWVITGAEDGVVRIMRFQMNIPGQFDVSQVLGEHVGGSAVRAVTSITSYSVYNEHALSKEADSAISEPIFLLISVGAKEVLTSWLLEWENEIDGTGQVRQMLSSRWLNTKRNPKQGKPLRSPQAPPSYPMENEKVEHTKNSPVLKDLDEDDHRYMAVTAFSVFFPHRRSQTCFAVTASSNATLSLHAFELLARNWVEIATLDYHKAPVLTLQHLVIPQCGKGHSSSNMYIVFSGATDGSIAVWNLTNILSDVCHKELRTGNGKVHRPPSGRGSQGGRRWKSSKIKGEKYMKERVEGEAELLVNTDIPRDNFANIDIISDTDIGALSSNGTHHVKEEDFPYLYTLTPEFVLLGVHQSGVNSLSVSTLKSEIDDTMVVVVSGGDDQALHVATFAIANSTNISSLDCCSKDLIVSAHSSAIKGVWTDGSLVFSTGLDQRLRCWNLETSKKHCSLVELAHSVINVPEPAGLHVECFNRRNYRIAVVGRGLQIFEVRGD